MSISLNKTQYEERTAAGTTNVVTALENTKGVRIAQGVVLAFGNGYESRIELDGNTLIGNSAATTGAGYQDELKDEYLVPAGVAIDLVCVGASVEARIRYEVLS